MTAWNRLERSMLAGALTGVAVTLLEATRGHAALAAAARTIARGGHESVTRYLGTVFTATTVIVGLAVFAVATAAARRRARRYGNVSRGGGYGEYW